MAVGRALLSFLALRGASPTTVPEPEPEPAPGDGFTHGEVASNVACWGDNAWGQTNLSAVSLPNMKSLSAGGFHTCGLSEADEIVCWGTSYHGVNDVPSDLGPVLQVHAGKWFTCAVRTDGETRCWGRPLEPFNIGEAYPTSFPSWVFGMSRSHYGNCVWDIHGGAVTCWGYEPLAAITPPADLGPVYKVAVGVQVSCAILLADYTAQCWGANVTARNGVARHNQWAPIYDIGVARTQTCLVDRDTEVHCFGTLGNDPADYTSHPPQTNRGFIGIASTEYNWCAWKWDGSVVCWGWIGWGYRDTNVVPPLPLGALMVSGGKQDQGGHYFCALLGTTTTSTSSSSTSSSTATSSSTSTVTITSSSTVTSTATRSSTSTSSTSTSTVTITSSSTVTSTATSSSTSTMSTSTSTSTATRTSTTTATSTSTKTSTVTSTKTSTRTLSSTSTATRTSTLSTATSSSSSTATASSSSTASLTTTVTTWASTSTSVTSMTSQVESSSAPEPEVASQASEEVVCWGDNSHGQLNVPSDLPPLAGISLGGTFACGWTAQGAVHCFGSNGPRPPGDLGAVSRLESSQLGVCKLPDLGCWGAVTAPSFQATGMALAGDFYCVWDDAGKVMCWGEDGDGQASPPDDLRPAESVAVGVAHACALLRGGDVECWGDADFGALAVPASVSDARQLAAGFASACAVVGAQGAVVCWGKSTYTDVPAGLANVDGIASAVDTYCAWRADKTVTCWGDNDVRQRDVPPLPRSYVRSLKGSVGAGTHFFCALLADTTTTTTSVFPNDPEALSKFVDPKEENSLVAQARRLASTAAAPSIRKVESATLAAFLIGPGKSDEILRMDLSNASQGSVTSAALSLTATLLASSGLEGSMMVVRAIDAKATEEVLARGGGGVDVSGNPVKFYGAVALRIVYFGDKPPATSDQHPLLLALPTVHEARTPSYLEMVCAVWDEAALHWSTQGIKTLSSAGQQLFCAVDTSQVPKAKSSGNSNVNGNNNAATNNNAAASASLFAGILRGFVNTLLCTNVEIFSGEAFDAIFVDRTFLEQPIVLVFTVLQTLLAILFVAACVVDARRASKDPWKDEKWLLPAEKSRFLSDLTLSRERLSSDRLDESDGAGGTGSHSSKRVTASQGSLATASMLTRCQVSCMSWCKQSAAVRDALDDVFSRWFIYFSEVRDFIEGTCGSLAAADDDLEDGWADQTRAQRMATALIGNLLAGAARRQAAMSLGVSTAVLNFLLDDEDLKALMVHAAGPEGEEGVGKDVPDYIQRLRFWLAQHDEAIGQIDRHWSTAADWRALPRTAVRFFLLHNPFSAVFLNCDFVTCHARLLLLSAELLGSTAVATLFFHATGSMTGKRSRGECSPPLGLFEQIGRLLAIGLVALVLASLPVCLLASLNSRGLRKCRGAGSPEWQRQIRIWRVQDAAALCLGLLYNVCCSLFVFAFLANIAEKDLPKWAFTTGTSILEDVMVIPICVGVLVPVAAMGALALGSWLNQERREELMLERRRERERRGWYKVVTDI